MQAALAAFESWKNVAVEERAGLLFRVAEIIRKRKPEFNAWMVLEVGKNWDEAEADTCEAIDFWSFTPAWRCIWPKPNRPCSFPANAISCATSRWAWARSSRPGISRWRSCAA